MKRRGPSWGLLFGLALFVAALFVGMAAVRPFIMDAAAEAKSPLLSDSELQVALIQAETRWRDAAGSVTTLGAPYRSNAELKTIYEHFKKLRLESETRHAKGN